MPFPFGVSVGDFIACIELINTVIKCLDESQGSATKFQGLIQSLKSLQVALVQVNKVKASNADESLALRQASMQCCSTLSSFVQKMNKYQPSLQIGGSGNHLKDGLRKVQWALYTKDDIAHFQAEIRGHVDSILLLLHAVHASDMEATRLHIDCVSTDIQLRIAEQKSVQLLLYVTLMRCANHLQSAFHMVVVANIALFSSLLNATRSARALPTDLAFDAPAVLEDAFGYRIPIHTQCINSWTTLDFVLRQHISENMQLPRFARAGRYLLRRCPTYEEVPRGAIFNQVFRPGNRLVMPLVLSNDDKHAGICPGCQTPNNNHVGSTLQCNTCDLVYTRSNRLQAYIRMLPAHEKPRKHAVQTTTSTENEVVISPARADPLRRLQQLPTTKQLRFEIVKNVKNVEFSSPRMILVLDLLGFKYTVPWHMMKTADKAQFFLRQFTAGGSILDWGRDYIIIDNETTELTIANWEASAYPGISIVLNLRNGDGNATLRQLLRSKVQDLLSSSTHILRHQKFDDALEEVCLLVGATNAQFEIRSLVHSFLFEQWRTRPSHQHPPPNDAPLSSICLICGDECATMLELAKHTQCHLIALRCERNCDMCEEQKLPYFMNESPKLRSESRISSSRPTFLRGNWVCCLCRTTNLRIQNPERCSIDGHYICARCYVCT